MNYILKNYQTGWEKEDPVFEYLVFNSDNKTQSRFEDTPKIAINMAKGLNLKPIAPIKAHFNGMFNYKYVELKKITL